MAFTVVPDRAVGYAPVEADWDTYIKDNFNSGVWVQLANSTLAVDTASIDFQSISGSWAHLMLEVYARGSVALVNTDINMRFNNDSGANYDYQRLIGNAATVSAQEQFAQTSITVDMLPAASSGANLFSCQTIVIPHYANSANNKAVVASGALKVSTSSTGMVARIGAGFWRSNAAITRVTLLPLTGNFVASSRATLYGLP